jgi:type IV secretory pathway VirB6-like protein
MSPFLISALMLLGTAFSLAGTIIIRRHKRQLQKAEKLSEAKATLLYALDAETGEYREAGYAVDRAVVSSAPLASKKTRKVIGVSLAMLLVFISPMLLLSPAEAALSESMRGIFSGALRDFVTGIMSDTGNDIYTFTWMMFLAGTVFLVVTEVAKFIFVGRSAESNLLAICWWFATFAIMNSYNGFTEAIWGAAVGVSNGYQQYLVGNTDNFFLAQWVHKAMAAVVVEDLSLFDGVKFIIYYWSWMVAVILIDLVAWLAGMWADFGYALAKVVGLIFIPFLLIPATRNLFDSWFKFFVGFGFLLIVLKATMVVAAISVKAIIESLGVSFQGSYGDPTSVVEIAKENLYLLSDASAMLFIAFLFVLSSFAFASSLAGGLGNMSGGLGTAANMAVRKILK